MKSTDSTPCSRCEPGSILGETLKRGHNPEWHLLEEFLAYLPMLRTGLLKIVAFARMASSSVLKQRFARTDFRPCRVLTALPRANRVFIRINTICIKTRFLNKAQSVYSLSRISDLRECHSYQSGLKGRTGTRRKTRKEEETEPCAPSRSILASLGLGL